ncbi:hydrogenase maturation nickel metallochaperone HypA [Mobiluncus curtisii]|uniref:Hydrogenase maturation factor HypA n=2 Tax=Mobiluncus curtisii TaxID=2051 RepID=D6ZK48_MOBCV|nr:hydrogenase maturation nickel metallochaperone HypA [Mobiluncus curtisii]ADI67097.1 putative hydrogenase nickel insertion protein HypA [Mobiluncus curtisii ATCC 43063]QQU09128.1 hydrogenase maturation nickel metallochaperone HypA [Mobiluncus curtisii]SQB65737.1 hydrogenase nickel incorporation protein [Mobiluncus curtisii]
MHELGLLTSVVAAVEKAAAQADSQVTRVEKVALDVGTMSEAIPEALYGSWPIARQDSICAQAELEVTMIPASVYCPRCARDVPIDEFFALTCPECGMPTGNLTHGREFKIAWVQWDTEPEDPSSAAES